MEDIPVAPKRGRGRPAGSKNKPKPSAPTEPVVMKKKGPKA